MGMGWEVFTRIASALLVLSLFGCEKAPDPSGDNGLALYLKVHRIGSGADQWIEMKNMAGEWERTGLIFGYASDDYAECVKAISGMKRINFAREYRCVPAN